MNRAACLFALLLTICAAPRVALGEDAPPTQEQLAQAKKAFEDGNALYKAGKLEEAVVKLKESFQLSRNAFLLYNIGHTYDQLGKKDQVLFYYRKFIASAPANAPMRDNVAKRVAELEAEGIQEATPELGDAGNSAATTAPTPTSKYGKADFKHDLVYTVPPSHPVDITAFVPQESGFTVTLLYRVSGEASFISKPMTWRNMELVARIPATKVTTGSIQYYLEVRDPAGARVTRSGKATSPNLVNIERGATPHYYADFLDEGGEVFVPVVVDDNALGAGPTEAEQPRNLGTIKWITTGASVALLGTSLVSYLLAGNEHDKLLRDAYECGAPPCRPFDAQIAQQIEKIGVRYDTVYKITLGVGAATTLVAGYLWYRELTAKPRSIDSARRPGVLRAPAKPGLASATSTAWRVAPIVDPDFAGATAVGRF